MNNDLRSALDSRWWYIIATVPVVSLAGLVLIWFQLRSDPWVGDAIRPYVYLLVVVLFVHPVAIYFDAKRLKRIGAAWAPDPVPWVSAAVLGIMLPMLSPIVAVVYLTNRFRSDTAG